MLINDPSAYALCPDDPDRLRSLIEEMGRAQKEGIPINTLKNDAWGFKWVKRACEDLGFPWMQPFEARSHLEVTRAKTMMAIVMMWIASHMSPGVRTSRKASTGAMPGNVTEAQPSSALSAIHAYRRVQRDCGRYLAPLDGVGKILRGLCETYKKLWGADSLVPQRREPFSLVHLLHMVKLLAGALLTGYSQATQQAMLVLVCFAIATGIRLDEICSEECYKRSNFVWIDKEGNDLPSTPATHGSRKNGDLLRGRSVESKCDPHNVVWGSRSMWFRYDDTNPLNFAWRWSRWEQAFPVPEEEAKRHDWPAFSPEGNAARFSKVKVTALLFALMVLVMGATEALKRSFHAFRVTIATTLISKRTPEGAQANCDGTIQMMVRWKTSTSMRIYARVAPDDYANLVDEVTKTSASPLLSGELPPIGPEEAILEMECMLRELETPRRATTAATSRTTDSDSIMRHPGKPTAEEPPATTAAATSRGRQGKRPAPPLHPSVPESGKKRGRPRKEVIDPQVGIKPMVPRLTQEARPELLLPEPRPRVKTPVHPPLRAYIAPVRPDPLPPSAPSLKAGHPRRQVWLAIPYLAEPAPAPAVARRRVIARESAAAKAAHRA